MTFQMKPILNFLRTTLVGGLLFLVPIIAVVMVLGKAFHFAHMIVDPLVAHLHVESVVGLPTPMPLAIALIVAFCFFAGLFSRSTPARKIVQGLEDAVLSKVPRYEFLKGAGESVLGVQKEGANPVVLVRFDDNCQIGIQVDKAENGLVAVFVPDAPNPQSGSVYFVTPDRVQPANIPLASALQCLKRLGAGSKPLLRGHSDVTNRP